MYLLDTRNEEYIKKSLANILNCNEDKITGFVVKYLPRYSFANAQSISLEEFYQYFNVRINDIKIDYITLNHVTTRFKNDIVEGKPLKPLSTILGENNLLTEFMKNHEIVFEKHNTRIETFYKGNMLDWNKFDSYSVGRLKNRLWGYNDKQDICVNGFLFQEEMDNSYIFLTGIPEIIQDIVCALDREDIGYEYCKKINCYVLVCKVDINDFLFDTMSKIGNEEKKELLLKHMINFLICKFIKKESYIDNEIVRIPDSKKILINDIISIRQIFDYKEIFQH